MSRAVIVVANHRSGSSVVTQLIHRLGFDAGRRAPPDPASAPTGHYEDLEFLELHQEMLGERHADGTIDPARWRDPRPAPTPRLLALYDGLIRGRCLEQRRWAVKDPRLCVLLPLLMDRLDAAGTVPAIVHVVRDLRSSAASLVARDNACDPGGGAHIDLEEGARIITRYEIAKWQNLKAFGRHVAAEVRYEELIEEPGRRTADLAAALGVEFAPQVATCVRKELDRWRA